MSPSGPGPVDAPGFPLPAGPELLDLRGLRCPIPLMRARARLARLSPGEALVVVTDDPRSAGQLPEAFRADGHAGVGVGEDPAGVWRISVRRRQPDGPEAAAGGSDG